MEKFHPPSIKSIIEVTAHTWKSPRSNTSTETPAQWDLQLTIHSDLTIVFSGSKRTQENHPEQLPILLLCYGFRAAPHKWVNEWPGARLGRGRGAECSTLTPQSTPKPKIKSSRSTCSSWVYDWHTDLSINTGSRMSHSQHLAARRATTSYNNQHRNRKK